MLFSMPLEPVSNWDCSDGTAFAYSQNSEKVFNRLQQKHLFWIPEGTNNTNILTKRGNKRNKDGLPTTVLELEAWGGAAALGQGRGAISFPGLFPPWGVSPC